MLGALLGSVNKERVLVYLAGRGRGYAREVARFFGAPLSPVQKAMDALEGAGVLVSRSVGTAREYEMSLRYAAREELAALVMRAIELYPEKVREELMMGRGRPRRKGKPL